MKDITHKQITLRTAKAIGIIFCAAQSIEIIKKNKLPKGNLFDVARAAGFVGAKSTPQLLPHCHPVCIDGMDIEFEFLNIKNHAAFFNKNIFTKTGIVIIANASSIGRTGIEMETLTAVSIAALEIYDMLKPIDTTLEIGSIKLLEKHGGKSDRNKFIENTPSCAILVCSDSTAAGTHKDISGKLIKTMLIAAKANVEAYKIVPDDKEKIQSQIKKWVSQDVQFIFTTGGTGIGPRDNTTQAIKEIIEKEAVGIAETMRSYGQLRTPLAMMSNSIAGVINNTLIVTLPGSSKGAKESLEAILPTIFHARQMVLGAKH